MKIAVLGGTGFMGYDFVKRLLTKSDITPLVYCTGPASLSNLARHDVPIRYVPYARLGSTEIDADIDYIVNFAHPFSNRDGLTPSMQIDVLVTFLKNNLTLNRRLRLIHISTMSVYEPFEKHQEYLENNPLNPPRSDVYAYNKYLIEKRLRRFEDIEKRMLLLRPTVVFGPFCGPWTDNILSAFNSGDVAFHDLGGKIQPIYTGDVSRFLNSCLTDFSPGVFNLAGPEALSWHRFMTFFSDIVGRGSLIQLSQQTETPTPLSSWRLYLANFGELLAVLEKEVSFAKLIAPFLGVVPQRLRKWLRSLLIPRKALQIKTIMPKSSDSPFCQPFFAQDRLVSMKRMQDAFPDFDFTKLNDTRQMITDYFRYRFTDKIYR